MIKLKRNVFGIIALMLICSLMTSDCADKESETKIAANRDLNYGEKEINLWDYTYFHKINDEAELGHKIEIKFSHNQFDAISKHGFLVFTTEYPERIPHGNNEIEAMYVYSGFWNELDRSESYTYFQKLIDDTNTVYDWKVFKIEELGQEDIAFQVYLNEPVNLNTLKMTLYASEDDTLSMDDREVAYLHFRN